MELYWLRGDLFLFLFIDMMDRLPQSDLIWALLLELYFKLQSFNHICICCAVAGSLFLFCELTVI